MNNADNDCFSLSNCVFAEDVFSQPAFGCIVSTIHNEKESPFCLL